MNPPAIELSIPDSDWEPIGPERWESPAEEAEKMRWSRIIHRGGVKINGASFHLEGWAVEYDEHDHMQVADYQDEDLGLIHRGVGADGSWDTLTIGDREYVLVMSPYC